MTDPAPPAPPTPRVLHLGQDGRPVRPLRRDATRNREKALCAARRLFAEHGTAVTMEEVAAEAGIGKGTLYRGFPSRGALAQAVLDALARDLQGELLRGFGVADQGPLAVLQEFLVRMRRFISDNLDLFCMAREGSDLYLTSPGYVWQRHTVAGLLSAASRQGLCPAVNLDLVPDAMLSLMSPDLVRLQRDVMGIDAHEAEGLTLAMLRGALGLPPDGGPAGSPLWAPSDPE